LTVGLVLASAAIPVHAASLTESQISAAQHAVDSYANQNLSNSTLRRIVKEVGAASLRSDPNASTASGTIFGNAVAVSTASSSTPFSSLLTVRSGTVTVNGHALYAANSRRNIQDTRDADTVTIKVDGQTIYSGLAKNVTESDALALANALGLLVSDVEEQVQRETARTAASVLFRVISQRVSFAVGSYASQLRREKANGSNGGAKVSDAGVGGAFRYGETVGIAGGNGGGPRYAAWVNYNHSFLDNDEGLTEYEGNLDTAVIGADAFLADMVLVGLAASHEKLGLDTLYNDGRISTRGYTLAPYAGLTLLEGRLVFDAMFAYSWLDTEKELNRSATASRGDYGGHRTAAAGNVTFNHDLPDLVPMFGDTWGLTLSPGVGVTYAKESANQYALSSGTVTSKADTYVGDVKIGARASLWSGRAELYTSHYYLYDMVPTFASDVRTGDVDRDAVQSALGINWKMSDKIAFTAEVNNVFGREHISDTAVVADVRISF